MEAFFVFVGIFIFLLMGPVFYRVIMGPTSIDRFVGANIIGTKTAVLLVVIGVWFGRIEMFVDFALTYALLNFIGSLAVSRYLLRARGADVALSRAPFPIKRDS